MLHVLHDRSGKLAPPVSGKIYEGRVARVHADGDPLEYPHLAPPYDRQYRDAAGLAEIAAQLKSGRPQLLLHPPNDPPESGGLIARGATPDVVGQVIDAWVDGDFAIARILFTDQRAIAAIDAGMHELSLGYTSVLNEKRRQIQITVDHSALVPVARCGPACSLQTDCAAAPCKSCAMRYTADIVEPVTTANASPSALRAGTSTVIAAPGHSTQDQIKMDELQKQLTAALTDAASQKTRADKLEAELVNAKAAQVASEVAATNASANLATARANADAAVATEKTRADAAEKKAAEAVAQAATDAQAGLAASVQARVALEVQATRILGALDAAGKPVDRSKLTDRDIKVAIIKHVDHLDIAADKVPAYVDGVYEGALIRATNATTSVAATRNLILLSGAGAPLPSGSPTVLIGPEAEVAARQKMADNRRIPANA